MNVTSSPIALSLRLREIAVRRNTYRCLPASDKTPDAACPNDCDPHQIVTQLPHDHEGREEAEKERARIELHRERETDETN